MKEPPLSCPYHNQAEKAKNKLIKLIRKANCDADTVKQIEQVVEKIIYYSDKVRNVNYDIREYAKELKERYDYIKDEVVYLEKIVADYAKERTQNIDKS